MKNSFCVVYRIGEHFFSPRSANDIRGIKPDAVFMFGAAKSDEERDIRDVAMTVASCGNVPVSGIGISEAGQLVALGPQII